MLKHIRRPVPEHYFHVIYRCDRGSQVFQRPKDYRDFLQILREGLTRVPMPLHAYCVVEDHWRLVLGPTGTARLCRLVRWVAATHAASARHQLDMGCVVAKIAAPDRMLSFCRQVERDALSAGLVRRAQDWPWSSLADRLGPRQTLPLTGTAFMSSDTWIRHVNADNERTNVAGRAVPPRQTGNANVAIRLVDLPDSPRRLSESLKRGQDVASTGRRTRQHQSHTHVERPEHLRVVEVTGLLKPAKQRWNRPAVPVK